MKILTFAVNSIAFSLVLYGVGKTETILIIFAVAFVNFAFGAKQNTKLL